MVKVILERTGKGENPGEIARLLSQIRGKGFKQPGCISGEILHTVDDLNLYLAISTGEAWAY